MIGQNISHYKVTAKIGAGGMGEVYRATDTKLNRDVAIKVLPEAFAKDEQRMARFQREAQVLASLNHQHIATIHGLEESGTTRALVMELVEGPTLAERIVQGAIPFDEALPIAKQIAEALEYAHEHGIVHRDLKPANIKLTTDGQVKVLDFGLAKALSDESSVGEMANSPTLSVAATKAGIILGTAAYMSPEQAKGKTVDRRTDIWAFGVVLYEMLTGTKLYDAETVSESLAAVLMKETDFGMLPAHTPASIRNLLKRCLTKDSKVRLRDIGEARITIENAIAHPDAQTGEPGSQVSRTRAIPVWQQALPWAVALIAIAIAGWSFWRPASRTANHIKRFDLNLPPGKQAYSGIRPTVAISEDGQLMAFVLSHEGGQQIYLRRADTLDVTPVGGTQGGDNPFFSPDGQWLAFNADGKLRKVRLSGGLPTVIADTADFRGGTWLPDDTIVFSPTAVSGLWRIGVNGGTPQELTKVPEKSNERTHRWPYALPGGRVVLFAVGTQDSPDFYDDCVIDAVIVSTGERKKIFQGARAVQYFSATRHLIYDREGSLYAISFDPEKLLTSGKAVPVLQGVTGERTTGASNFAVAGTSEFFYMPGLDEGGDHTLSFVDSAGKTTALATPLRPYFEPSMSPDGKRVAVSVSMAKNTDLWIYDMERNSLNRLTFNVNNFSPVWSPDGKRIFFRRDLPDKTYALVWKSADGSGEEEILLQDNRVKNPNSVSPDGKLLSFDMGDNSAGQADIFILPLTGDRKPVLFQGGPSDEAQARFSPDGRWIAYQSNETGPYQIYVRSFPSGSGRWQISTAGGEEARWSPNGKELYYRSGNAYMIVPVETAGATLRVGTPKLFADLGAAPIISPANSNYSVSHDGKRILVALRQKQEVSSMRLVLVLNWAEEILRATSSQK